ncbi:hypothetical protein [Kutzneria buriramensis]|uniref:Uncharacterized protein n=1 Tax=Kutzneria buriramensis TaxID=1045776 RepID=A0A3E0G5T8_9PSEU|nr:hypothetical protein [Kutzneria buriramensis]REH18053.1 hypothetical protein BCF44_13840 [Kutzneria buriramensis]
MTLTVTPQLRAVPAGHVLAIAERGFTVLPKAFVDEHEHLVVPLAELAGDELIADERGRQRLPEPGVDVVVVDGESWAQAWWIPRAELHTLTAEQAPVSVWATRSGRYLRRHAGGEGLAVPAAARWSVLEQRAAGELLYRVDEQHLVDDGSRLMAVVRAARAAVTAVTLPVAGDAAGEAEAFAALATWVELLNQTVVADLRRQRAGVAARVADQHDGDLEAVARALSVHRPVSQWTLKDLLRRRDTTRLA